MALKLAGGAYPLHPGLRLRRGARDPLPVVHDGAHDGAPEAKSVLRAFGLALLTQASNPKTALVCGGIFAALLPASPPGRPPPCRR